MSFPGRMPRKLIAALLLALLPAAALAQQPPAAPLPSAAPAEAAALAATRLPPTETHYDPELLPSRYVQQPDGQAAPQSDLDALRERLEATENELARMKSDAKGAADKLVQLLGKGKPSSP